MYHDTVPVLHDAGRTKNNRKVEKEKMNEFLKELSELLKKYDAEIWSSADAQCWNRIGVECKGRSIEIDDNVSECFMDCHRVLKAIK